ncbi:hypothetical protein BJ165DRAFT_673812 [Panaeolus papilionaceus]|nr:hypothetical protein BJ165DRAFT_673812 [Panaeolus papilionaceus]
MDQTSACTDPVFPNEIFNQIIEELYMITGSHLDIERCSLVCRDFASICQSHIFREVQYDYGLSGVTRQKLVQTLTYSPHLSTYIRSVKCEMTVGLASSKSLKMLSNDLRSPALQIYFPNLQSLKLVVKHACYQPSRSCECYRIVKEALDEYVPSQGLTRIAIEGSVRGLLPVLLKFPNMEELSLKSCLISTDSDDMVEKCDLEYWSRNLRNLTLLRNCL